MFKRFFQKRKKTNESWQKVVVFVVFVLKFKENPFKKMKLRVKKIKVQNLIQYIICHIS